MRVTGAGLAHSFDGQTMLFSGLDFVLTPGDLVAVVGPSGSGKSTLLGLLAGWITPSSGTVQLDGIETVSWVFQNPLGVARRTVLDHVVLPLLASGMRRAAAEDIAHAALARFGLGGHAQKRFADLSGGEGQRLMLARASVRQPDLLLVDEPTAQLDRALAASVNGVLGQISSARSIVVVATHDADTMAACHRVINLDDYAAPAPAPSTQLAKPAVAVSGGA